jgi:hypothetical protein
MGIIGINMSKKLRILNGNYDEYGTTHNNQ